MKQTKYLIIGNSAAAVGTIEGIRQVDTEGSILLVSSEPYHTYSRPLISYLLLGKTDSDRMKYRPDDFYKNNSVECLFGQTASKIEAHDHIVTLSSGEEIKYEKLLIGTGSRPLVPELPGLKSVKNKFTFMSLDDAKALDAAITSKSRVLILGAGLIGLKCAEGIHRKAAEVTVVGRTNRILRSIIDEDASDMIKTHIESKGIKFHLSDNVESLTSNKAKFKSGD
ncbi:MAG: NAD(P)/FAD-dependent oxidoreductase, partial [Christensenellaceae bacterium]